MNVPHPTLETLLRRPVAYHRAFVEIAGDVAGAVFLSWLLGLAPRRGEPGVEFSLADCYRETGLTRHQQARIRQALRAKGILRESAEGFPKRTVFAVDRPRLAELLSATWDAREEIERRATGDDEPESGDQGAGKRLGSEPETGRLDEPETGSLLARARGEESCLSLPEQVPGKDTTETRTETKTKPHVRACEGPAPPTSKRTPRKLYQPDDPKSQVPIPAALQRPEFLAAWREWCAERAEKREPLTLRAAHLQLRKLLSVASRRGVAVAVQTIERSIECGWMGLFEPDESTFRGAPPAPAPRVPDADATALEVARRRLFALAFEAQRRGEIDDAYLAQVQAATKGRATMVELDTLGQKIRGW